MIKTAEAVSLGHPDKTADFISSYILDRFLEHDSRTRYGVEVMVKNNTVVLGGEISSRFSEPQWQDYVYEGLRQIGYDEKYAARWQEKAININRLQIINLVNQQSAEIAQGVDADGWGDQGVFVGYACQGEDFVGRELFLARRLNRALYAKAREGNNLGLDIKTQITLEGSRVLTAVAAVPMLEKEDLSDFICQTLGQKPAQLLINTAGDYTVHSSVADCGMTGRKLAVDFYGAAAPLGGGSPWTKDATKADLTLNLYARRLAVENLADNDEVWVYLSSCIGQSCLPSAVLKARKGKDFTERNLQIESRPSVLIEKFGLNKPIFADLCRNGLI
ncbi:MAG: methionine adenosyltransferase domain-containing protein [Alphaproteobacteria bacterium]|nr:methionine adenosyltransferase domain-containing protein [Alphaproteobacteria bacterium]